MIKILIVVCSLLCLGSAWNQPSTCYARQSSLSVIRNDISELKTLFQSANQELKSQLDAITSTLGQLVDDRNCQVSTTDPPPTAPIGSFENPATSCSEVSCDRPSGYYWLVVNESSPLQVYCDTIRTSCSCNTTGGWMRVANFDMTNPNESCPNGFRLIARDEPPLRTCGRNDFATCRSVIYPVHGIPYSQVCGRVKAYQEGTPDSFSPLPITPPRNISIDDWYVDGVSLTHGQSPRHHIWTFSAGVSELFNFVQPGQPFYGNAPSFVGNDYFCDTANEENFLQHIFLPDDPLWDGEGCGTNNTCCEFNNPPWFCRHLPEASTDDIELRICGDQGIDDEDIPIEIVEIFVR